ncbi:hypothetical protein HPB50_019781 [Hyalomma asiaticum]|uniref:Uncharacterized protein n=1 Tax=Hyalomma asiaticum TaxID=266040 RepID=A0ACB7SRB9_HYAAI|nr:hypothetical protein HPB50_019781 [Hyalomma asiaticum]
MPPASRTRSRTPTAGLTSMTPPSTERTLRTLQPSARSTKIDTGGGRLIGASADHKVDATAESVDLGTSLPTGTAETPTPGTPAEAAGHSPAVRGRGTANVLAALHKRVSTATAEFRLGTPIRPQSAPPSPSSVNPAHKYYSPMSGTSTLLAGTAVSKEHTLLKTELIVGCVSCIVLVFLLVFGVTKIALSPAPVTSKHCLTHACRAYSERLFTSINRSVNPCAHFTRFVCDGWQRRQNLDVWEDRFLLFMNRLHATLNSIRIPATGQNGEQRAAALYRSCYDVFHGSSKELGAVKEALASAGITWPQPSREADALFTLLYSSLKLGWDALLNFRVVPRSGESTDELVVSQGRSFDMLREWFVQERETTVKRAYFEFIRDNFASSGGNGTTVGTAVTVRSDVGHR